MLQATAQEALPFTPIAGYPGARVIAGRWRSLAEGSLCPFSATAHRLLLSRADYAAHQPRIAHRISNEKPTEHPGHPATGTARHLPR